jgi:2-keto-4-pentenoate hydratase/2-oxohepta-3-ene-1,7-dioic acid hydratase in catechol pathway
MKLAYFNDYVLGVIKGDTVVDVAAVVADIPRGAPEELMTNLIARFDSYRSKLEAAAVRGKGTPLSQVRLRSPLPKPPSIVCMAANYNDGLFPPQFINAFHKSTSTVIAPDDTMILPDVAATIFEGEAEMAFVIGKQADNVSEADAMKYVFGYTNLIDGSARDLPIFFQMKSRKTFTGIGPYLVTADEIPDPHRLQIRSWTNGALMQNYNSKDMAYLIPKCVAWLSSVHVLERGTVVATGTHHGGLNPLMDGDTLEVETDGLGRLKVRIRDDLKRTWERKTRGELKGNHPPQKSGKYMKAGPPPGSAGTVLS